MTIPRELAAAHDTAPVYALALPPGVELAPEPEEHDPAASTISWALDRGVPYYAAAVLVADVRANRAAWSRKYRWLEAHGYARARFEP